MTGPDGGPTTSNESVYLRLGELSGKMDNIVTLTTAMGVDAALSRAAALKLESRLEENKTVEKANAAAAELSNRRFLGKLTIGALSIAALCLGILYYLHSIYHWPT